MHNKNSFNYLTTVLKTSTETESYTVTQLGKCIDKWDDIGREGTIS